MVHGGMNPIATLSELKLPMYKPFSELMGFCKRHH